MINPLQFLPLIENRRQGTLNYRAYQVAKGEIPAGDAIDGPDLATIERIIDDTDLDTLKAASARCSAVAAEIAGIKTIWHEKSDMGQSISLDRVSGVVNGMAAWLASLVAERDPTAVVTARSADAEPSDTQNPLEAAGALTSSAQASAALAAAADYFARMEPSNPALLLVRQAQEMVGKSFIEVMRMLVPAHVESAAINIGRDKFFNLPIERMAELATSSPSGIEREVQDTVFSAENRAQALGLLTKVAAFFRTAEPSSPIPFWSTARAIWHSETFLPC
ncbi:hypothetical protein ACTGJ9_034220 [Bradyrhizobium sp. RDM12]